MSSRSLQGGSEEGGRPWHEKNVPIAKSHTMAQAAQPAALCVAKPSG